MKDTFLVLFISVAIASVAISHISYQILLRVMMSWGMSASDKLPGMGVEQNLRAYVREVKKRGVHYAKSFWWLVISLGVNFILLAVFVARQLIHVFE